MKTEPSLWIFRPFGQPSYSATRSHSPLGLILKMRPNGMSTHHRLPLRSNDGPSRKLSTAAPWRLGSDHAVRVFLRNLAGSEVKGCAAIFFISWNGFNMWNGMPRSVVVLAPHGTTSSPPIEEVFMKQLLALALAFACGATYAQAPSRIRGTITKMDGNVMSVKTRDGKDVQVTLAADTAVATAKKA